MPVKSVSTPKFTFRFLLPKYWPVWLGMAILYVISWLPFSMILRVGKGVGYLLQILAKKRVAVARRNIELTFPQWNKEKKEAVLKANIERTGIALFETAMGWWWPGWRVKKHIEIEGFEHVEKVLSSGKGLFGLALHNVNLEFACRAIGYRQPSIGFYRKHNNPLVDYLQYHGRSRSNKYMIDKRNAKAFIQAMNQGELCLYLPDQDYGAAQSIFVPFGGVEKTATTTATLMFAERANCVPMLVTSMYTNTGYKIKFFPAIEYFADNNIDAALTQLNKDILSIVELQPESYLWMHKRFKTRPEEAPESLYERLK
ncbi:LpxL/LpxP family Kdo(2)-lipid IV(A) lauroyl/palmitoleoyl acyltransferase [Agaribacter flavus]|uniref:Lipid A biosynthesis acyltransferase n=1 Tax=Agaribacter flavus TaxID=1902781 RepID=A0ABV7FKM7_9ALTE